MRGIFVDVIKVWLLICFPFESVFSFVGFFSSSRLSIYLVIWFLINYINFIQKWHLHTKLKFYSKILFHLKHLFPFKKPAFIEKLVVTAWSYLRETMKWSFFSLLSIFFDQNTSVLIKGVAVSLFHFSGVYLKNILYYYTSRNCTLQVVWKL